MIYDIVFYPHYSRNNDNLILYPRLLIIDIFHILYRDMIHNIMAIFYKDILHTYIYILFEYIGIIPVLDEHPYSISWSARCQRAPMDIWISPRQRIGRRRRCVFLRCFLRDTRWIPVAIYWEYIWLNILGILRIWE